MTKSQLHRAVPISLDAIRSAEANTASDVTYGKLEAWFDAFEEEAGHDVPARESPGDPHMVTIRGSRGGDIDVVVSGPVEDIDKLAATVERLLNAGRDQAEDDPK